MLKKIYIYIYNFRIFFYVKSVSLKMQHIETNKINKYNYEIISSIFLLENIFPYKTLLCSKTNDPLMGAGVSHHTWCYIMYLNVYIYYSEGWLGFICFIKQQHNYSFFKTEYMSVKNGHLLLSMTALCSTPFLRGPAHPVRIPVRCKRHGKTGIDHPEKLGGIRYHIPLF